MTKTSVTQYPITSGVTKVPFFTRLTWACVTWENKDKVTLLQKGTVDSKCKVGTCNPVNFTVFNPGDSRWERGYQISNCINGRGLDPETVLIFQSISVPLWVSTHRLFHSFYEEIESGPPPIPAKTKNLFLALAETIAQILMVTSCYVCGGTNKGDQWPWEKTRLGIWHLKTSLIDKNCLAWWGQLFNVPVGKLTCLGQKYYNTHTSGWWGSPNYAESNPHSLAKGLYWICGTNTYSILPTNWPGSCVLGTICPTKKHRSLQIGDWKDDEWSPECIIQYYRLATWAEDGSWGYQTPIYMLNRIIQLQAVIEIITNETAKALNLLAEQQTRMHNAIYQNCLALDYLLFDLSNCCLQIDDSGKVIEEITRKMTNSSCPSPDLEGMESQRAIWGMGFLSRRI
ncbi:hypothetical protein FD754_005070 [Muntiacus muntjak]|uniref:Uncharacterized protein n=1 Tax=Muntiacus muntjak TaxID=9888 RepID=A0A5N3WHF0_MUNMU|nr:hypothetical protein FD754_005070 [Muntiacus muntjak]